MDFEEYNEWKLSIIKMMCFHFILVTFKPFTSFRVSSFVLSEEQDCKAHSVIIGSIYTFECICICNSIELKKSKLQHTLIKTSEYNKPVKPSKTKNNNFYYGVSCTNTIFRTRGLKSRMSYERYWENKLMRLVRHSSRVWLCWVDKTDSDLLGEIAMLPNTLYW